MSYEAKGSIERIYQKQTFDTGFEKQEFVLEVKDGKYDQLYKFELIKDNISKLNGINVGDEVSVTFDIRGNEYNDKVYSNLVAWKLEKVNTAPPSINTNQSPKHMDTSDFGNPQGMYSNKNQPAAVPQGDLGDLPF